VALSKDVVSSIMKEVSLAPSAHNSQPAVWSYFEGEFHLCSNAKRRLPVADPSDHDLLLSLGAQIEGLDLSLKARNKKIGSIKKENEAYKLTVVDSDEDINSSELYKVIDKRKTFRGAYTKKIKTHIFSKEIFSDKSKYLLINDDKTIKKVAKLYDESSLDFFRNQSYTKELYSWLRFSKKEKKWHEDGLNQDAMSLNAIESFGASQVLKPKVFKFLDRMGLASLLVSEAPKIKTSSFILCLVKKRSENDQIELGRFFYRAWLFATLKGLNLCPLSNLVDHPAYKEKLEKELDLSGEFELFKIFRAGPEPESKKMPGRYRINFDEYFKFNEES